jgi:glyoxylase-like metal-dependent hydrolase (beta-lactamase superfamily II)
MLALLLVSPVALAQAPPDWAKVEIKTHKLAEGVYMLEGMGGNIGVFVGEDGVLVIDDQFAPLSPKIRAAIAKLSKKPIRFVLNTHWHGDHVGGNEPLAKAGAVIVAHENVRKRMSAGQFLEVMKREVPPAPAKALPIVTFTQDVTFYFNGDEIRVMHPDPAHTDGDSVVLFKKANVIHTGDCYMTMSYPYVDAGSGGSFPGFIAVADKLIALADANTKIIPGHGGVSNRAELTAWRDMLVTIRDRVQKLVAQKKTLAEVVAAKPSAEWDQKWGVVFITPEQVAEFAYRSLTK